MIFSIETFKDKYRGINTDIMGNNFDIVLGKFHLGFSFATKESKNHQLTIQCDKTTYFLSLWQSKRRAKDYFSNGFTESETYKSRIYGSL